MREISERRILKLCRVRGEARGAGVLALLGAFPFCSGGCVTCARPAQPVATTYNWSHQFMPLVFTILTCEGAVITSNFMSSMPKIPYFVRKAENS